MSGPTSERPYLSIGEVLGLLLEEFPDVTISKIRFLESQGLIDPERTPSGYRKFYDGDVDRLRMILREQRENFLPLKVIRDRLERGAIEGETGSGTPPRGIRNVTQLASVEPDRGPTTRHHPSTQLRLAGPAAADEPGPGDPGPDDSGPDDSGPDDSGPNGSGSGDPNGDAPLAGSDSAERSNSHHVDQPSSAGAVGVPINTPAGSPTTANQRDSYSGAELCSLAGITADQLAEIESFGLISGRGSGVTAVYGAADLAIASAAAGFLRRGVEGRHLRAWRQAAEREAALFEQLILPHLRQRNPQARQQAAETLTELTRFGGELRAALMASVLRHHLTTGWSA